MDRGRQLHHRPKRGNARKYGGGDTHGAIRILPDDDIAMRPNHRLLMNPKPTREELMEMFSKNQWAITTPVAQFRVKGGCKTCRPIPVYARHSSPTPLPQPSTTSEHASTSLPSDPAAP